MATVILDSSIVLALFDTDDALHNASVSAAREARDGGDDLRLPTSVVSEVMVGVARQGTTAIETRLGQVRAAFGEPIPLTTDIAIEAAKVRAAARSIRLPDAIVLATARAAGAKTFTGDKRWRAVDPTVTVIEP